VGEFEVATSGGFWVAIGGKIDQYVHLLEQLGANETLASVYGLGKACLITADITCRISCVGDHPVSSDEDHLIS
jgi:hypothetical protein